MAALHSARLIFLGLLIVFAVGCLVWKRGS